MFPVGVFGHSNFVLVVLILFQLTCHYKARSLAKVRLPLFCLWLNDYVSCKWLKVKIMTVENIY